MKLKKVKRLRVEAPLQGTSVVLEAEANVATSVTIESTRDDNACLVGGRSG